MMEESPLLITKPWLLAGISRSTWFQMADDNLTPPPVAVPGKANRWRRSDIEAWVRGLKPRAHRSARGRKKPLTVLGKGNRNGTQDG